MTDASAKSAVSSSILVVVNGNVCKVVERDRVVVVVFQQVIVHFSLIRLIIDQQIIVIHIGDGGFGFFAFCLSGLRRARGTFATRQIKFDNLTRVRAADGRLVQIVKPFAGGWANPFGTPFFFGHNNPLLVRCKCVDRRQLPHLLQGVKGFSLRRGAICCSTYRNPRLEVPVPPTKTHLPLPGAPGVTVLLRRSRQARRLSLRVSQLDGRVTLSMPLSLPLSQAQRFLTERTEWVRAALRDVAGQEVIRPGAQVLWQGQTLQIAEAKVRTPQIDAAQLLVPPDPDHSRTARKVAAFLRFAAQQRLTAASDRYAAALGRGYRQISLRDTRSRWGSCTADGRLMYSWRLIMAPPDVLDYVAAHEIAHLAEMNHSARFWAHVARLMPDYPHHRAWLRQHGRDLHRYDFSAPPLAGD